MGDAAGSETRHEITEGQRPQEITDGRPINELNGENKRGLHTKG